MATNSSILAWEIPYTEEPGGLQSMGLQRVRHDWVTKHTCTWYDSTYRKRLDQTNSQRQKLDQWLSGAQGKGHAEHLCRHCLLVAEKCVELGRGAGHTQDCPKCHWLHFKMLSLSCIGEGNGNPLQCSCLENPRDGGAWWTAVCGVAQSQTWLKQLSSSSSSG